MASVDYSAENDILRLVGTDDLPTTGKLENDARFAL